MAHEIFPQITFGAPEFDAKAKAYRALRAAERIARRLDREQGTCRHVSRLEELQWHENYWDDSSNSELGVYTCDWNALDEYVRGQGRVELPGGRWPELLSRRLEKLGADIQWSDEHSTCGDCGKLVRTEPDGFGWRPEFHVGHGEITCLGCMLDHTGGGDDVLEGCARILWVTAWADAAEESGVSLSGCDLNDEAPETPEEARDLARAVLADLLRQNRRTLASILESALRADIHHERIPHFDNYAARFGECMAYASMGAGVSWADDHDEPEWLKWSHIHVTGTAAHTPGASGRTLHELALESLEE